MFRFTIRELVLLTLVVGIAVGRWSDRSNRARENRLLRLERNAARDSEIALRAIIARDPQSPSGSQP